MFRKPRTPTNLEMHFWGKTEIEYKTILVIKKGIGRVIVNKKGRSAAEPGQGHITRTWAGKNSQKGQWLFRRSDLNLVQSNAAYTEEGKSNRDSWCPALSGFFKLRLKPSTNQTQGRGERRQRGGGEDTGLSSTIY